MSEKTLPIFLTVADLQGQPNLRVLIESLRSFGGELSKAPFWIFTENPIREEYTDNGLTRQLHLEIPPDISAYPFGKTVAACAQAETMVSTQTNSLVWIDPSCLVIQPPLLFDLGSDFDAAFRPVHIRNIGLPVNQAPDVFWRGIYESLGLEDPPFTVTSFVDSQHLRPYFNSHSFSINPRLELMRHWHELFQQLIRDKQFQDDACSDDLHKIFLFQALLSSVIASEVGVERLRILPASYNYPYNLHARVPADRQARTLNELVCLTYEGRDLHPNKVNDVQIIEPLRSWLIKNLK